MTQNDSAAGPEVDRDRRRPEDRRQRQRVDDEALHRAQKASRVDPQVSRRADLGLGADHLGFSRIFVSERHRIC